MGSDRTRTTFDEKRQYRRVVHQQGRVSLEADLNEAQEIFVEGARLTNIDFVGATGAPAGSKGYEVRVHGEGIPTTDDLTIGHGPFYLGGFRLVQAVQGLRYSTQAEHDWTDGPSEPQVPAHQFELVYLRVSEREISAVEDRTLLEPAIGGPDTAQRVRLVTRVERRKLTRRSEEVGQAFEELKTHWRTQGLTVDPTESRLERSVRLEVTTGAAGYLGPENQMIRVQVARSDASGRAPSQLLWAYDNGSALYRVDLRAAATDLTKFVLKIVPPPVDVVHQPKAGQAVEILLPGVSLGANDYAAQTDGLVATVTAAYDPAQGTIAVDELPLEVVDAKALFVRVWQNTVPFTPGSAVSLIEADGNDTGLSVTISGPEDARPIAGDYWSFAVRCATPKAVYPARYHGPQLPDGPREWACPLAIVDWGERRTIDCRPSFGGLATLSREQGCCAITISPSDLKTRPLQAYLDEIAERGSGGTLCLKPGTYVLDKTLRLNERHSGVTIEACSAGVEIRGSDRGEDAFDRGLLEVYRAERVALRGIHFVIPEVSFPRDIANWLSRLEVADEDPRRALFATLRSIRTATGVRLVGTREVRVEDCDFSFARRAGRPAFGGAIVATGDLVGLDVNRCTFRAQGAPNSDQVHILFGFLHIPPADSIEVLLSKAVLLHGKVAREQLGEFFTHPSRGAFVTRLTDAAFRQNTFTGLAAASLALSEIGSLRIQDNQVKDSYGGFWLLTQNAGGFDAAAVGEHDDHLATVLRDPILHWSIALARCLDFTSQPEPCEAEPINLDLCFHGNTAHVASAALIGWHTGKDDKASAIVSANHLTNTAEAIPTGLLVKVHASTLTGNVLIHRAQSAEKSAVALVVSHGKTQCLFAASGNVHVGEMRLPREGVLRDIIQAVRGAP